MATMGSTKVDLSNQVGLLEAQLSTHLNNLRKIESISAQAEIKSAFEATLANNKNLLDERKQQIQAQKALDSDILGSDAESEDGQDVLKALEVEQDNRGKKLLIRKDKKLAEAVKASYKAKKTFLHALIGDANKLLVIMDSAIGETDDNDLPVGIINSTGPPPRSTKDVLPPQKLPAFIQLFREAEAEQAQKDSHKFRYRDVNQELKALKLSVKEAFGADETAILGHTVSEAQTNIIVAKLKVFHDSQQIVSIPIGLSILRSLDASQVAGTFVLHEVAKLQARLSEMATKNKTLVEQNSELAQLKTALASTQKEAAKYKQDLKEKEHLLRIGINVCLGSMEAAKRIFDSDGDICVIRGNPKKEIIEAKNAAVHRGQFLAHKSLYTLGYCQTKEFIEEFRYLYGVRSVSPAILSCPKVIEVFNLRGSMVMCYYKTRYTHDKAADAEFDRVYGECINIFNNFVKEANEEEACKKFSTSTQVETKLIQLRRIVANTTKKERDRLHGR